MFSFLGKRKTVEKITEVSISVLGDPNVGKTTFKFRSKKQYEDKRASIPMHYDASDTKTEQCVVIGDYFINFVDLPGHDEIKHNERMKTLSIKNSDSFIIMISNINDIETDVMKQLNKVKGVNGDSCIKPIFIVFNKMDKIKGREEEVFSRLSKMDLGRRYNGKIVYGMTCLINNEYLGEIHTRKTRGIEKRSNPVLYVYEYLINEINHEWVATNGTINI